jgi:hypothetical protein
MFSLTKITRSGEIRNDKNIERIALNRDRRKAADGTTKAHSWMNTQEGRDPLLSKYAFISVQRTGQVDCFTLAPEASVSTFKAHGALESIRGIAKALGGPAKLMNSL